MKNGYAWVEAGRVRAAAMTPDLPERGDRIEIPAALALDFLAGRENMAAWRISRSGRLLRADDPGMWEVDDARPTSAVTSDANGFALRIRLRIGLATRRVHASLESDVWLRSLPDDTVEVVGTVDDFPVFGEKTALASLVNGGVEWTVAEGVAMDRMVFWVPTFQGIGAYRTEDGDELPVAKDTLPVLMLAEVVAALPSKTDPCLLITRKRRALSITVNGGGGRRYASPPSLLPVVVTVAGDPTMILHGEKISTADLLAGKSVAVKLPASVARAEIDVQVGRLFENVRMFG